MADPLMCMLLTLLLLGWFGIVRAQAPLESGQPTELPQTGHLYQAANESFPATVEDLSLWLAQRQAVAKVSLLGGAYWLYAEIYHNGNNIDWVFNPSNTLIDQIEWRIYDPDGQAQILTSGYANEHEYALHYGKAIRLKPNMHYRLLARFSSPYFASYPQFSIEPEKQYWRKVAIENAQIFGILGALVSLALYNLFIYTLMREKSRLYYVAYLAAFCLGWAFVFHIPADFFGWRDLRLHYVPFFLLPVLNTLFYLNFLDLPEKFPKLAAISRVNLWLPLLLLPSCFFALSYAHLLATMVISLWLLIALVSGIACWRAGYRPAGYFVLAFLSLCISGAVILPGNFGLVTDIIPNSELLTLMCGALDALLLAFALADKIRLLYEEKDDYLRRYENSNRLLLVEVNERLKTENNIRLLNAELEERVLNRTYDLRAANNRLQEEVSERKQIESALQDAKNAADAASHAKDEFLANMSHEIRTPMNAIIGLSDLALKTELSPKQRDYLAKIYGAGSALLGIINDILDFSKIEAGKLAIESVNFAFADVLDNVATLVERQAKDKGLALLFKIPANIPPNLVGDPLRLSQVLTNLFNNAVKFTERGEIEVAVELLERSDGRVKLQFTLRDTGIGMTPEQATRVFQAFAQADGSTTRKYGGTGLGLSICKRLVELMRGDIWVESESGQGSRFMFTAWFGVSEAYSEPSVLEYEARGLSKEEDKVAMVQEKLSVDAVLRDNLKGAHVLLAEDNEINQLIVIEMLDRVGVSVDVANDGLEAVDKFFAAPQLYAAVLMDLQMPKMDGYAAAQAIRADPRFNEIPILAITAHAMAEERERCIAVGMNDHITKPINPGVLLQALGRWIKAN